MLPVDFDYDKLTKLASLAAADPGQHRFSLETPDTDAIVRLHHQLCRQSENLRRRKHGKDFEDALKQSIAFGNATMRARGQPTWPVAQRSRSKLLEKGLLQEREMPATSAIS